MVCVPGTVDVNNDEATSNHMIGNSSSGIKGMVLPFVPLSIAFEDIKYSIDMPEVPQILKSLPDMHVLYGKLHLFVPFMSKL